jgi:hypothetical protein
MNSTKKLLFLFLFTVICKPGFSQVIISLLFGDKLNSGKIEFGLDGGLNLPTQTGTEGAKTFTNFNLGFYFDIKLNGPWMIHTGVLVKSNMGSASLPVYPLNDPSLDSSFTGGSVTRKLNYFNVPVCLKYTFKNNFFVEAGPMFGLLYKAFDDFTNSVNGSDLSYKINRRKDFFPLDMGVLGGIGYRFMKGNGMNIAIRYYLGFIDVLNDGQGYSVKNRNLYFAVGIPIGAGKAKERAAAKEAEKLIISQIYLS